SVLLPQQDDLLVININTEKDRIDAQHSILAVKSKFPDDFIVCMIYTSGSSGKPKGVGIQNSSLVNRIHWMWNIYPFKSGEKCALKTSISFVDHIWELFGPLNKGVPSVLFTKNKVLDINEFLEDISNHNITRLILVPSLLMAILDKLQSGEITLKNLKYWISSGEQLSINTIRYFYTLFSKHEHILINIYGSTEITADATYYETNRYVNESVSIPIGRPIANTQIYILGPDQGLVPVGVTGEI
ncbi:AMP-binding protein, partial [Mucilaginibacter sp. RCC_168]|uniref:AMP-binding protein n=1 Tax=Mucilaginibacter sp. RCC_168 TaxID=3239221 RepID=UPI003524C069